MGNIEERNLNNTVPELSPELLEDIEQYAFGSLSCCYGLKVERWYMQILVNHIKKVNKAETERILKFGALE